MVKGRRPSANRAPSTPDSDSFRDKLHALSSFAEAGPQAWREEREAGILRQALLAAVGATGAATGAALRRIGTGEMEMVAGFGVKGSSPLALPAPCGEAGPDPGPSAVRLSVAEAASWRRLLRPVLPSLRPSVSVRLESAREVAGYLVLGTPADDETHGDDELAVLATLARLFTLTAGASNSGEAGDSDQTPIAVTASETNVTTEEMGTLRKAHPALRRFIGDSAGVRRILADLVGVAGVDCPLLIEGPSGSGKELVARIAHAISCASSVPFEAINCAAIPDTLVESELFGHVAGSFTGATRSHRGVFERARGGTVFLDEVGDMPATAQAKLLRVLQDGTFLPVGGEQTQQCTSRIMAATNSDLKSLVAAGRFREDLYYRLNVFPIRLPAIRDRRADIPLLLDHFLARHAGEMERSRPAIDPAALGRLSLYSYPGNVREIQNIVRALLVQVRGAESITDRHVVDVFSRHRVEEDAPPGETRNGRETGSASLANGGASSANAAGSVANGMSAGAQPANGVAAGGVSTSAVGDWVREELRRYFFNIALAERMLEKRSAEAPGSVPVSSRSGLTYYLQGECLRALAREDWDSLAAAEWLAGRPELVPRMQGKLERFIETALATMRGADGPAARRLDVLRRRFAKLPACYTGDLERLVDAYDRGILSHD